MADPDNVDRVLKRVSDMTGRQLARFGTSVWETDRESIKQLVTNTQEKTISQILEEIFPQQQ